MIDTIDDIPTMKATHNDESWMTVLGIRLLGATGALFGITALFAALLGALGLMVAGEGMALLAGPGTSVVVFLVGAAAFALRTVTLNAQQRMAGLI
jgi:hypothetical protein